MDFFVVPTAGLKVLFVLVILSHGRRRVLHANATDHPTADLVRDRDAIYGEKVRRQLRVMHVEDIVTAPASPWQNAYVERLIGSIRRELLDHVVVLDERHLRRLLKTYFAY